MSKKLLALSAALLFITGFLTAPRTLAHPATPPATPNPPSHTLFLPLAWHQDPLLTWPLAKKTGHPLYLANYANSAGCNWMGVFGQVYDESGLPINNLQVHIEGRGQSLTALTGAALQYGWGYYEIVLGNVALTTTDEYTIWVTDDQNALLSPLYSLNTRSACTQNLILVSFETR